jgi:hypothetical protein
VQGTLHYQTYGFSRSRLAPLQPETGALRYGSKMRRARVFETPRGQKSWDRAMCLISQSRPVKKSYRAHTALLWVVILIVFLGVY